MNLYRYVARFALNIEWDFFGGFQILWLCYHLEKCMNRRWEKLLCWKIGLINQKIHLCQNARFHFPLTKDISGIEKTEELDLHFNSNSQWVFYQQSRLYSYSHFQIGRARSKYCENFTSHWTGNHRVTTANGKNEVRGEFWDSIFKLSNKNVTFHKLLRIAELCERGNWLWCKFYDCR